MIKNILSETLSYDILWDLDGKTLQEAAEYFKSLAEDFADFPGAKIDIDTDAEHKRIMSIIHQREETDEEAKIREDKSLAEFMRKQNNERFEKIRQLDKLKKELNIQ